MKLALIGLERKEPDPPLGLAYLAAYARKYGGFNNIVIIDKEDPIKAIRREKPDLVGISAMTYEFPTAMNLAKEIKRIFSIPLMLGGHHISLMPSHFDKNLFDLAVLGEGEQTLLELIQLFEKRGSFEPESLKHVKGIMYHDNNKVKMTERRPLIENLDSIPFPARDLLKMKQYYVTIRKATFRNFGIYLPMLTSRGCPYNCAFCSIAVFWQRARFHSAEYVVNEMKQLIDKYKVDGLLLYDDLFIANKSRLREIANLIKQEKVNDKIEFHIYGRTNLIDEETCKLLKQMNVSVIEFGLESGSERTLKYLKKGNVTVANNRNALRICKNFGFKTVGSFIIGAPRETEKDLKETLSLVRDVNLDQAHVYQLTPYPGTEVWEYAKSKGLVSDDSDFDLSQIYLRQLKTNMLLTNNITSEAFEKWYWLFQREVEKKQKENKTNYLSLLKLKYLKYLLSRRFITKVFKYRKNYKMIL